MRVVCPHCNTTNQVPEERLDEGPRCGKCRESLFGGGALELSGASFQRHLERGDLPLLVDFWAPWCGPCRMIAPVLEEVAKDYEGKIVIAKVNTDENPQWAMNFGVQGIPTLLFIAGGEVKDHQVGAGPAPALKSRVADFLDGIPENGNGQVQ